MYRVVWASFIGCGVTDNLLADARGMLCLVAEERLGVCTLISVVSMPTKTFETDDENETFLFLSRARINCV